MTNPAMHPPTEWLARTAAEIQADYERLQELARQQGEGTQQSGHEAEGAWEVFLQKWLPPGYGTGTRRYLLFEKAVDGKWQSGEQDLVIFHPAYPEELRKRKQVMISGVVAAFSVKLTLVRKDIEKALDDARILRRGLREPRRPDPNIPHNVWSPLVFGLLAHSKRGLIKSKATGLSVGPQENISEILAQASRDADLPRENLDLVCVDDLNCWRRSATATTVSRDQRDYHEGFELISEGSPNHPAAALVGNLWQKLAIHNPALAPIAHGLWASGVEGGGGYSPVARPLEKVIPKGTVKWLELTLVPGVYNL